MPGGWYESELLELSMRGNDMLGQHSFQWKRAFSTGQAQHQFIEHGR